VLQWLTLGSLGLAMPLFLVFALVYTYGLSDLSLRPWAVMSWAVVWGLFAGIGLCGVAVGLVFLLRRPARLGLSSLAPLAIPRWPKLAGLATLWCGVWVVGIAASQLVQLGPLITRYQLQHVGDPGRWFVVLLVTVGPRIGLTLAELLPGGRQEHDTPSS